MKVKCFDPVCPSTTCRGKTAHEFCGVLRTTDGSNLNVHLDLANDLGVGHTCPLPQPATDKEFRSRFYSGELDKQMINGEWATHTPKFLLSEAKRMTKIVLGVK